MHDLAEAAPWGWLPYIVSSSRVTHCLKQRQIVPASHSASSYSVAHVSTDCQMNLSHLFLILHIGISSCPHWSAGKLSLQNMVDHGCSKSEPIKYQRKQVHWTWISALPASTRVLLVFEAMQGVVYLILVHTWIVTSLKEIVLWLAGMQDHICNASAFHLWLWNKWVSRSRFLYV